MVCVYLFFRNVAQGSDYTMHSVQAYIRVLFSHGMKLIIMKGSLTVYLGLGFVNCVFRTIACSAPRQRQHSAFGAGVSPSLVRHGMILIIMKGSLIVYL